MREIVAWAVPLMVSLFLIQFTADLLSWRAANLPATERGNATKRETIRGPVHEVDRAVTADGVIT